MRPAKMVVTLGLIGVAALLLVLAVGTTIATLRQPEESSEPTVSSIIEKVGPASTPEELVAAAVPVFREEFADELASGDEYERYLGIEGEGRVITYFIEAYRREDTRYNVPFLTDFMTEVVCTNELSRYLLRGGVELVYDYRYDDSTPLARISTTESECQALGL